MKQVVASGHYTPWHLEYGSDTWITGGVAWSHQQTLNTVQTKPCESSLMPLKKMEQTTVLSPLNKKGENNALTQSNINKTYENHLMSTGQQHSVERFTRSSFCKRDADFRKIYVEYPSWSSPREEQEKAISIYTTALQLKTSTKKNHGKLGNMLITLEDKYPPKLG